MSATDSGLCTYAYEFFISYPQMAGENQRHLMDDFAAQLKTALDYNRQTSRIAMAFRDRDCLKPGYIWQEIIPRILCQSRSMLLVFNEEYFSREYCVMEFCAMQKLERLRGFAGRSGESLIIPLILQSKSNEKGEPLLPVPIARLSFVDFRMVRYPKKQFKQNMYRTE